jgi:Rrf2 family protein
MLHLSQATINGLYALHYLARRDGLVTVGEIARHGRLTVPFLAKALQRLGKIGLVRGERGRGYRLARPAATISVLEVVRGLQGPILPEDLCLMGNRECVFRRTCPLSHFCRELSASVLTALDALNLLTLPVGARGLPVCMDQRRAVP